MRELDTYNRFRDSFRAKAAEDEGDSTPVSPNVALLKRVERIIFSPNVKTLEEAAVAVEEMFALAFQTAGRK